MPRQQRRKGSAWPRQQSWNWDAWTVEAGFCEPSLDTGYSQLVARSSCDGNAYMQARTQPLTAERTSGSSSDPEQAKSAIKSRRVPQTSFRPRDHQPEGSRFTEQTMSRLPGNLREAPAKQLSLCSIENFHQVMQQNCLLRVRGVSTTNPAES